MELPSSPDEFTETRMVSLTARAAPGRAARRIRQVKAARRRTFGPKTDFIKPPWHRLCESAPLKTIWMSFLSEEKTPASPVFCPEPGRQKIMAKSVKPRAPSRFFLCRPVKKYAAAPYGGLRVFNMKKFDAELIFNMPRVSSNIIVKGDQTHRLRILGQSLLFLKSEARSFKSLRGRTRIIGAGKGCFQKITFDFQASAG
ncbi:MAG: hypothetical protein HZB23_08560 [Deltaproteobacteria bacterium]|nr:hypothetical protein [Deltaproteobacteria bacterium]